MSRRTIIFVLGMYRSGTSALTRVLSLSGATLPPGMLGAGRHNPQGFWEPRRAVFLNDGILRSQGSSSIDPRIHNHAVRGRNVAAVRDYLAGLPVAPVVVVKDLQITALAGLWFEAAALAGFDVAAAVCVRHPGEVVASVDKMASAARPELGAALWLKYTLLAERYTRGIPRVIVDYANLLDHWQHEVKRVSAALSVDLNPSVEAVEGFLRPGGRHQVAASECPAPFGMGWTGIVYEQVRRAARDGEYDRDVLDRTLAQYCDVVNGFGCVFDSFHKVETVRRIFPRPLARAWIETLALAHGRRGTWA